MFPGMSEAQQYWPVFLCPVHHEEPHRRAEEGGSIPIERPHNGEADWVAAGGCSVAEARHTSLTSCLEDVPVVCENR